MFKTVMIIAIVLLALGWVAYAIWDMKMRAEEKKGPRQVSKHLQKTRSEVSDWAKKMAAFKKPTRKPQQNQENKS